MILLAKLTVPLALLLGATGHAVTVADVIIPADVEYASNAAESGDAKVCQIVVAITNATTPERIGFMAFAAYDKLEGIFAVGFLIGASERSPSGEFGLANISSAAFNSARFNSPDEMDHEISGDGTIIAATSDARSAGRFLESVAVGNFYLTLSAEEPERRDWRYKIESSPPVDVQQSFAACLDQLPPNAASGRMMRGPI